ncbi:MAG: hypothetical protein JXP34_19220 [Planctomycetes bacterium]|nr:hypothetical protein [Planctomycetota bacterium]
MRAIALALVFGGLFICAAGCSGIRKNERVFVTHYDRGGVLLPDVPFAERTKREGRITNVNGTGIFCEAPYVIGGTKR